MHEPRLSGRHTFSIGWRFSLEEADTPNDIPCTICAMPLLTEPERRFLTAVAGLAYSNPFLPERTEYERAALGRDYVSGSAVWSASVTDPEAVPPNLIRLRARLAPVVEKVRARIAANADAHSDELAIYEDSAQYLVYERYYPDFGA